MKNRSHELDINSPKSRHIIVNMSMMFRCDVVYMY